MLTIFKVPDWWFLVILAVTFTFGVVCIEIWPTELPVWGYGLRYKYGIFQQLIAPDGR